MTILSDAIAQAIDEGLMVPEVIPCAEWVRRFGWTSGQSAVPGPYDMSRTPYVAEILNAVDDPRVRQISIIKGSQVGITELYIQILGYMVDRRPRTTMVVFPTADTASEANKDRITPALAGMPPIRNYRLKEVRKDGSARVVRYRTMTIFYRGANSKRQTETIPAGVVIGDELDRCPPGTAHLLRQRGKTYPDFKMILLGKPEFEGMGIDFEYQNSDKRQLYVPCPECGDWHTRRFSRVRWYGKQRDGRDGPDSRDFTVDATQAEQTACYKCGGCGTLIKSDANVWQLQRGVWCPAGARIAGKPDDGRVEWIDGERPASSNRGYHIPELISGLLPNPYGPAAKGFVERKGVIDQLFANDHEGRAWKFSVTSDADLGAVRDRIDPGHRYGVVPNDAVALVAFADIQDYYAYVTVTAFSAKMEKRWLVWAERVPAEFGKNLTTLDAIFYRTFTRADGRQQRIVARGIDSGDGERTMEVYRYCSQHAECWALKGVGVDSSGRYMAEPHKISRISARGLNGAKQDVTLLRVNSHLWKQRVHRMLGITLPDDGVQIAPDDDIEVAQADRQRAIEAGQTAYVLPSDVQEHVLNQLVAEECVKVQNTKRGGLVTQYQWRLRDKHPDNHYFDCVYSTEALAHARQCEQLTVLRGLVKTEPAAPKPPTQPTTTVSRPVSLIERARDRSLLG